MEFITRKLGDDGEPIGSYQNLVLAGWNIYIYVGVKCIFYVG